MKSTIDKSSETYFYDNDENEILFIVREISYQYINNNQKKLSITDFEEPESTTIDYSKYTLIDSKKDKITVGKKVVGWYKSELFQLTSALNSKNIKSVEKRAKKFFKD